MGVNIGLDFGTTYSTISYLTEIERAGNKITSFKLDTFKKADDGVDYNASIAVLKDGKWSFANEARGDLSEEDAKAYEGFKMLLSKREDEDDETFKQRLAERGFVDETVTPEGVTKDYIQFLIDSFRAKNLRNVDIDKIVVGAPEIWFDTHSASRAKLEKIVREGTSINEVQIVSEPALAAAYFINNYKNNTGRDYDGYILLVDYGGGTLDIALCRAESSGGAAKVSVPYHVGAGANEEGFLGKAGMAFLETAVKNALEESGLPKDQIVYNNSFYTCVYELEKHLKDKKSVKDGIDETFKFKGADENSTDLIGKTLTYESPEKIDKYKVTYGALVRAYNKVIEDILTTRLNDVIQYMDREKITYNDATSEKFKIATVGGFCNFYLTQNTINKFKKIRKAAGTDKRYNDLENRRYENEIGNTGDRERAVAYGAALVANGIIEFKTLAPYTLCGVRLGHEGKAYEDESYDFYFFEEGTEIISEKPYFARHKLETKKGCFKLGPEIVLSGDGLPFIKKIRGGKPSDAVKPSKELGFPKNHFVKVGFSLDDSLILSMHIVDFGDPQDPKSLASRDIDDINKAEHRTIRLSDIEELMGHAYTVKFGRK